MNIFHINGDHGVAPDGTKGAAVHRRQLLAALTARGHRIVAFSRRPGIGTRDIGELGDVVAEGGQPDLIYERYSIGHGAGLAAARELGTPFMLEVNSPLLIEAARHRNHHVTNDELECEQLLFREADAIRVVSSRLVDHVEESRGSADGVYIIGNGHDPAAYPQSPSFSGPPTIAFLGHPKPWHGSERLVPLLGALVAQGVDAHLRLIGGGPGAATVAEQAHAGGVGSRVRVTGPVDERGVAHHLQECWVGVAPYPPTPDFYFSPLKVLDYLGAGLPVVATDRGDIGKMVGDAGYVVRDGELVASVGRLLRAPGVAAELGRRGRARARVEQTWDVVAASIEACMARATAAA